MENYSYTQALSIRKLNERFFMVHITHDDVRRIARLSHIHVSEEETPKMAQQLQSILSYASRVADYAQLYSDAQIEVKGSVVLRPDVSVKTDSDTILAAAPDREGNYFVVPVIVEAGQ